MESTSPFTIKQDFRYQFQLVSFNISLELMLGLCNDVKWCELIKNAFCLKFINPLFLVSLLILTAAIQTTTLAIICENFH